ncbi:unnamed protein product, partial [Nesidiocoris tenuis]
MEVATVLFIVHFVPLFSQWSQRFETQRLRSQEQRNPLSFDAGLIWIEGKNNIGECYCYRSWNAGIYLDRAIIGFNRKLISSIQRK